MAGKRQASNDLNHNNWDQEDEPQEKGIFRTATEDELKKRVIKKALRKITSSDSTTTGDSTEPTKNAFSNFKGFSNTTSSNSSPFAFLSKLPGVTGSSINANDNKESVPSTNAGFSFGDSTKAKTKIETSGEHEIKENNGKESKNANVEKHFNKSNEYFAKLKGLNQSVSEWIKTHVDKNPLCILTPIFRDYEKYLKELENEKTEMVTSVPSSVTDKRSTENQMTFNFGINKAATSVTTSISAAPTPTFSFASTSVFPAVSKNSTTTSTTGSSIFSKIATSTTKAEPINNGFSFGIKSNEDKPKSDFSFGTKSPPDDKPKANFSFGIKSPDDKSKVNLNFAAKSDDDKPKPNFMFGTGTGTATPSKDQPVLSFASATKPFTFGNVQAPAATTTTTDATDDNEDEDDQPPKVEFKQVVEDDTVYSKKCKVFVKKSESFVDRGVGTLYLKPVKDSEKTQLIVRADTNLGNILVNLILNSSIPAQRMGKNNVMLVCMPTPDESKPAATLLRVKTGEEADELLATIEKYKK